MPWVLVNILVIGRMLWDNDRSHLSLSLSLSLPLSFLFSVVICMIWKNLGSFVDQPNRYTVGRVFGASFHVYGHSMDVANCVVRGRYLSLMNIMKDSVTLLNWLTRTPVWGPIIFTCFLIKYILFRHRFPQSVMAWALVSHRRDVGAWDDQRRNSRKTVNQ